MLAPKTVHATCVALGDAGVLILGRSGAGKSALGLQLMALGCALVADDRVILAQENGLLVARCPAAISGMIEARGIGILNAKTVSSATIQLVVDLDQTETERMPQSRTITFCGVRAPLIHGVSGVHFVAGILQILKAGWSPR